MNAFFKTKFIWFFGGFFFIANIGFGQGMNFDKFTSQSYFQGNKGGKSDSLQKRDFDADTITIHYTTLKNPLVKYFDSSVSDYSHLYPMPYTYNNLGNTGAAAHSLIFQPNQKIGWQSGLNQYGIYHFTLEDNRLYSTTRPFSQLSYQLGSKSEQIIQFLHTQNKKENFNFTLNYRFLVGPGSYRNQNNSHSNFSFNSYYETKNKRYKGIFIFIANQDKSSENGGVVNLSFLDSSAFKNPFELTTRLGPSTLINTNPFNTKVSTGNIYKNATIFYQQYYDLGTTTSFQKDSTTYKVFMPRMRLFNQIKYTTYNFQYLDNNVDTTKYQSFFNIMLPNKDNINHTAKFKNLETELSLVFFPENKNLYQNAKIGTVIQTIQSDTNGFRQKHTNFSMVGAYNNLTRNKLWYVQTNAQFYFAGANMGDYLAQLSLTRNFKTRKSITLGIENYNKTVPMIYANNNIFWVTGLTKFRKENLTKIYANWTQKKNDLSLRFTYYFVNNYAYFSDFLTTAQSNSPFSVAQANAAARLRLSKYFYWYPQVDFQQIIGTAPLNLPLAFLRNRICFEGNFYTNLNLATGFEVLYNTPYKAPNYSPFTGQFFYQNQYSLSNLPMVNFFFNFRIRSFKGFFRLDHLESLLGKTPRLNIAYPNYPSTRLFLKTGFWWNFVN